MKSLRQYSLEYLEMMNAKEDDPIRILKDRRQAGLCMDRWAVRRDVLWDIVNFIERLYGNWNTFIYSTFGIVADEFETERELKEAILRLNANGFPLNYGYVVKNKSSLIGAAKKFAPDMSWNAYAQKVLKKHVCKKKHSQWDIRRVKKFIRQRHKENLPLGSYRLSREGFNQPIRIAQQQPDWPGNWKAYVDKVLNH